MPVPSLFDLTLPLLKLASEKEINYSEAADLLARQFGLTPEEAAELLPSGWDRRLVNRIKWAKVELSQADLVESTRPSHFRAPEAGRRQLASSPPKLDHKFLMGIPAYRARKEANRERAAAAALSGQAETEKAALIEVSGITPQEMIDQATAQIEGGLTTELLSRLADGSPTFFEKVVIDLLEAMGYGRNRPGAGLHVGGSGDGGSMASSIKIHWGLIEFTSRRSAMDRTQRPLASPA
jgi:restriction system protein